MTLKTLIYAANIDKMLLTLSIKTIFKLKLYIILLNVLLMMFLVLLRLN